MGFLILLVISWLLSLSQIKAKFIENYHVGKLKQFFKIPSRKILTKVYKQEEKKSRSFLKSFLKTNSYCYK